MSVYFTSVKRKVPKSNKIDGIYDKVHNGLFVKNSKERNF